ARATQDLDQDGVPDWQQRSALSLTIESPLQGQLIPSCQVPVIGTATGGIGIAVTVNGQSVATVPAGDASDAKKVAFSALGAGPPVTIGATALARDPVSTTVGVVCNQPPQISCPAPTSSECGAAGGNAQPISVAVGDPDGDPLTVTWTIDGQL